MMPLKINELTTVQLNETSVIISNNLHNVTHVKKWISISKYVAAEA